MYNFTIPMALMDFVPVIFFGMTAVILLGDLYGKMGKGVYALFAAGSFNVFLAGFCKEEMFMPVNSIGLLCVGLSLICMVCMQKKTVTLSVAPVAVTSSLPFIAMMVVGLGGMCASLSVLSVKMKKGRTMILFILSFICAMAMGYLSGQDSTLAWVNWTEQSINTVSQICLMLGTLALHKAGLKNWNW